MRRQLYLYLFGALLVAVGCHELRGAVSFLYLSKLGEFSYLPVY